MKPEDEQANRRCQILAEKHGLNELIEEAIDFAETTLNRPVTDKDVLRLWEHRDKISKTIDKVVVCKKGCDYCCHMAVGISTFEAEIIRSVTGRQLAEVPQVPNPPEENVKKYVGVPCPFLVGGACSIYEARPTACRTYFNLADDPELCNLKYMNDVPSIDLRWYWVVEANAIFKLGMTVADIREWFPEETDDE